MTIRERKSHHTEVSIKLNKSSNRLDVESNCYNAIKANLEQEESRCEELLKKLQSLDDRKKTLAIKWWLANSYLKRLNRRFDL